MSFSNNPSIFIYFDKVLEENMFIKCLGYNDFKFVKPIKYFRIQHFYTLHIVLEGSGTVKVGDKEYRATKGDMFFIPPEINLCYFPDDDNLWEYVWFELLGENVTIYADKMGFSEDNNLSKCKGFENVCFMMERLFANREKNIPVGYYDVLSCFYKILDMNIRKTENQSIVDSVTNYINCYFSRADLSVPEICDKFNISHSYLCRIFKNAVGGTVKSYITKIRINEACKLLETTDSAIKEVADLVGFCDSVHFMKVFKMATGKTPTEYRKSSIYSVE